MISYVLGAPGSGKSSIVAPLRHLLPHRVMLDWDAFMGPAAALAGTPIRTHPGTWPAYSDLVRTVAEVVGPLDVVLLGVCTPDEMADWPSGAWILMDCSDDVRRGRLAVRRDADETAEAVLDAAAYRRLGLPAVDTTRLSIDEAAQAVADLITTVERTGGGV